MSPSWSASRPAVRLVSRARLLPNKHVFPLGSATQNFEVRERSERPLTASGEDRKQQKSGETLSISATTYDGHVKATCRDSTRLYARIGYGIDVFGRCSPLMGTTARKCLGSVAAKINANARALVAQWPFHSLQLSHLLRCEVFHGRSSRSPIPSRALRRREPCFS